MKSFYKYQSKENLNKRAEKIYKYWANLPFCQSQCGKIVSSNFDNNEILN